MHLLSRDHQSAIPGLAVLVVALGLALWGCDESTGPGDAVIPVPRVSGVDRTVVSVGDTIVVTGADFDDDTALNRVVFSNTLARAVPFDGTTSELAVVVPRNALSGDIAVTRAGQPEAGSGPEVTVQRGIGEVFVVGGARSVDISTPPGSEYVVIPYATAGPVTKEHQYALNATELPPAATSGVEIARATVGAAGATLRESFESMRWKRGRELRERAGVPERPRPRADAAPESPQQLRQFNVWNTIDPNAIATDRNNYTRITAQLRFTGQHVLVYADVDTLTGALAPGNLTQADITNFGLLFDADIRPSAAKYFGTESDVDSNGKVIMLITPVVNDLTPPGSSYFIGGFFFPIDLYPTSSAIPSGTTNHAEIFYLLAGDPTGQWGVSQPRAFVAEENIKTIVHEYEHLISFSYRLFNEPANSDQITWLEEGMAHMGEDLLALETGEAGYNTSNEGRGKEYRFDTDPQFQNPDKGPGRISLEDSESPISQRGGIYLFLRLLGDRYGNGIYKQLLQSDCVGRECIEAITGEYFYDTVADFLAAMYISGRGITADARYNYQSIDLADFGGLYSVAATFDGANVGNQLRRTSGDFFVFSGASTATSRVTVSTTSSDMGLRTVFVRTR